MHISYYTRPLFIFSFIYVVFIYLITPLIIKEKPLIGDRFCGYSLSYLFEGKGSYYFYFRTQEQDVIVKSSKDIKISLFENLCIRGRYNKITSNNYFGNFNWTQYMNFKNIFWEIELEEIEFQKSLFLFKKIAELRYVFLEAIEDKLKESSSIVAGLVLGEKRSLSRDFKEAAIKCGIMHLMVASGSNISYFIIILSSVFRFFGVNKKRSYFYAFVLSFFYVLLIGFEPPISRAYLMVLFVFIFYFLKRNIDPLQILISVFVFFVILKPILIYDPSFVMSFLCVYGLIVGILNWGLFEDLKIFDLRPSNSRFVIFLKNILNNAVSTVISIFLVSIFCQLSLFVYISNSFYRFSIIALVSNVVLIPMSSFIVSLSLLSFILFALINIDIFFILEFMVNFFVKLVYFFSSFKYSLFFFSSYSSINSFSILLASLTLLHLRSLNLSLVPVKVFLSFVMLFLFLSFLWKDVVEEDILFMLKSGKKSWYIKRNENFYLIDPIIDADKIINAVYASRRNKIDYILVSSYDAMNVKTIDKLTKIFDIKKVYIPLWICTKEQKFECVFGGDKGDGFIVSFKDRYGYFNIHSKLLFCFSDKCF